MNRIITLLGCLCCLLFQANAQWVNFRSSTSRITIGDISITGDSITIEALINMQHYDPVQDANDIVSKHYGPPDLAYLLRPNDFAVRTDFGLHSVSHTIPLCFDSTYHVAGTYDGDSIRFFLNGVEVSATAWSGHLSQNSYLTSIGNVSPPTVYNEQFIGYIDELRIWKTARTANQLLTSMYDLPDPASQYGLVAYYTFNNTYQNQQGNTAFDGIPDGDSISNTANPYFQGSVSTSFCYPTSVRNVPKAIDLFSIYPNPASSSVNITYEDNSQEPIELVLTNLFGETMIKTDGYPGQFSLSLENLSSGIYFLTLNSRKGTYTQKILKE